MKKTFAALAIAALVAAPIGAYAAEKEGKVTKWENTSRTMTMDDGSTYVINETVKTESLKTGSRIKVIYDEKDGKSTVTRYEILK